MVSMAGWKSKQVPRTSKQADLGMVDRDDDDDDDDGGGGVGGMM